MVIFMKILQNFGIIVIISLVKAIVPPEEIIDELVKKDLIELKVIFLYIWKLG